MGLVGRSPTHGWVGNRPLRAADTAGRGVRGSPFLVASAPSHPQGDPSGDGPPPRGFPQNQSHGVQWLIPVLPS